MDSVIAKLDNSVFGMLVDQQPHIMISGIQSQSEIDLVNRAKPDFICFDACGADLRDSLPPAVRVLASPDDLPFISGADDARAMFINADVPPSELKKNIRQQRPDTVVIELKMHNDAELAAVRELVSAARSSQETPVD